MAQVFDLTGNRIDKDGHITGVVKETLTKKTSKDFQSLIDHIAYLNQEGRCASLMVAIVQKDGTKTKCYATVPSVDPATMIGTLESLKDLINRDTRLRQ